MRFLIDACGGYTVAEELRVQGHDVIFIGTTHPQLEDELILQRAIQERRIIVTTDKDPSFSKSWYTNGASLITGYCGWPTFALRPVSPSYAKPLPIMVLNWVPALSLLRSPGKFGSGDIEQTGFPCAALPHSWAGPWPSWSC